MRTSVLRCLPKLMSLQKRSFTTTNCLSYVLRSQLHFGKDGGDGEKCKDSKKPDSKKFECLSKKCQEDVAKKGGDKCKKEKKENKCEKKEKKCEKKEKDMTAVTGGTKKCKEVKKKPKPCPPKRKKKPTCEELILKRDGQSSLKCPNMTDIQGGTEKCPKKKAKKAGDGTSHKLWQKLSLFGAIPACILIALFVFQTHEEVDRGEFVPYTYKYRQTKGWFLGSDPRKTPFHNSEINALPHGFEDEIDDEAGDEKPQTDKEKAAHRKEGDNLRKTWNKKFAQREKEAKAAAATE